MSRSTSAYSGKYYNHLAQIKEKHPDLSAWVFFFGAGQGTLTPGLILGKDAL
jgi:hypothetical protein